VDDTIEDGVRQSGIADELVPAVDRTLAGYDQRAGVVCDPRQFPADRAAALGAVVPVPIIEDKEINAAELTYQLA
jgi:hypothetical protein